jgi:hypothetical protein
MAKCALHPCSALHLAETIYLFQKSRGHFWLRFHGRPQSFANLLNDGTTMLVVYVDLFAHNGTLRARAANNQMETETVAFGYLARALVFEQRVRRTFGYPRHAPFR